MNGSTAARRRSGRWLGLAGLAALLLAPGLGSAGGAAAQAVEDRGIRVVGRFDPASGRTTYEVAEPLGGREVLALQRALLLAGVSPGVPDGRLGPATRAALERYQTERSLRRCGCPSYETVVALGLEPRVTRIGIGEARRDAGAAGVRVIRPQGAPAGAPEPPAPGPGAGAGAEEAGHGAEPGPPSAYGATGYWIPVLVPGVAPVPPSEGEMPRVRRPSPRGVTPPGIRPSPPPRVTPPSGDGRSRNDGGSGSAS